MGSDRRNKHLRRVLLTTATEHRYHGNHGHHVNRKINGNISNHCSHGLARSQMLFRGAGLHMWRVAVSMHIYVEGSCEYTDICGG